MRSQPKAMPPCGGAPNWNASSRKPNFSWASSRRQAHDLEDALLHVAAVDTDRPAADLVAVADDVVGVGQRRAGVGVEGVEELGLRRGERVVHGGPRAGADGDVAGRDGIRGGLEQRRVDDPQEAPRRLVDEPAAPADLERGRRRAGRARLFVAPAAKKMQSPGFAPTCSARPARSVSDRFLATGPASVAVLLHEHVRQAAGAALLGPLLPGVELLARLARAAGHDDRADVRRLEDPERGVARSTRCSSTSSMPEAQVGLVGAVAASSPRRRSSAGSGVVQLDADQRPDLADDGLAELDARRPARRSSSRCRAG